LFAKKRCTEIEANLNLFIGVVAKVFLNVVQYAPMVSVQVTNDLSGLQCQPDYSKCWMTSTKTKNNL